MQIIHTLYKELPLPIARARALLRDQSLWAALPTGAERLGEFWRFGAELYRVTLRESDEILAWQCVPVGGTGPRLQLEIALHDATIATHATVTLTLDRAGTFWRRPALHHALARIAETCVQAVQARFIAPQPTEPLSLEAVREQFPRTYVAFEQMGALDHLERVLRLEQGWRRIAAGSYDGACYVQQPEGQSEPEYDLIYAGGGLGLLHAAVMAQRGYRVLLFDRGQVGCAHREWNISRVELQALVDVGFATWNELEQVMMRAYRTGLVRFHNGPRNVCAPHDLWLPGVLDVALDAGALLGLARRKLEQAGGTVLDGRAFQRVLVASGRQSHVTVQLERVSAEGERVSAEGERVSADTADSSGSLRTTADRATSADSAKGSGLRQTTADRRLVANGRALEQYTGRLLLDGMGSTSPLALLRHAGHPFAAVCPTVGTVAEGFVQGDGPREHDPTLGDILVTVADSQGGQQLMWEGFPGRGDELTVYLFYYDQAGERRHSLLELFESYFELLPSYKQPGPHFRHVKPVYGYIPARHSLRNQEAPLLRGVLPLGDSAAQQSPLTFCGFGSHVRNLERSTSLLDYALRHNLLAPRHLRQISPFQANVSLNWVFSRFMHPWGRPNDVNELQNVFLAVLNRLGLDLAQRFFQDRMRWGDYHKMVLGMFGRYPKVVAIAWHVLGPAGVRQWIGDYLRYTGQAALASGGRAAGKRTERLLLAALDKLTPTLALQVRARYAEWRAMGWVANAG